MTNKTGRRNRKQTQAELTYFARRAHAAATEEPEGSAAWLLLKAVEGKARRMVHPSKVELGFVNGFLKRLGEKQVSVPTSGRSELDDRLLDYEAGRLPSDVFKL